MKREDYHQGKNYKMLLFWACLAGFIIYLIARTGMIINHGVAKDRIWIIVFVIIGWTGLCILVWKNAHGGIK